jgi:hypothetical protein
MSGPFGESCGLHQYSPGFRGPVGVPLVCAEGFSTACAVEIRTARRGKAEEFHVVCAWKERTSKGHQKASADAIKRFYGLLHLLKQTLFSWVDSGKI